MSGRPDANGRVSMWELLVSAHSTSLIGWDLLGPAHYLAMRDRYPSWREEVPALRHRRLRDGWDGKRLAGRHGGSSNLLCMQNAGLSDERRRSCEPSAFAGAEAYR